MTVPKGFCPFAVNLNIPPGSNDPAIKPRIAILHVDAGNASSLYTYFRDRSGGIESHFFIKSDGTIEQYRSIYFQADANLDANDFAVSIETQGYGAGTWTGEQLQSIRRLLLWLNKEAKIPLRKCATWNGSGIGYHTLFGAPSHWTPVAKSCPGPERIKQFNSQIVPWLESAGQPKPKPPKATRVSQGRDLLKQALELLRTTTKPRPRVEKQLPVLEDVLSNLPQK